VPSNERKTPEETLVRKLSAFAFAGVAAAALAGTAMAAAPKTKVMTVPLPDGSVARVEYVGEVAPKVMVEPRPIADGTAWGAPFGAFAGFDRMIQEMNRRTQEMVRQAQEMARQPAGPGATPFIASFGNLPAGQASTTIVSVSNGGGTCTRTTQVVSQGPGKPPRVTTNVSGQCAEAPPAPSAGIVNPT